MSTPDPVPSNSLLNRLHELEKETDTEFVHELIEIYVNETPKQIQSIAAALSTGNYPALVIAAHTLKGSSLNLGAKPLGALCLKLEEIGRTGNAIPENSFISEIENEFETVKSMLQDFHLGKL